MRDLHYKVHSFRLNEKTVEELKNIKVLLDTSYNLTFRELIQKYKKYEKKKIQQQRGGRNASLLVLQQKSEKE